MLFWLGWRCHLGFTFENVRSVALAWEKSQYLIQGFEVVIVVFFFPSNLYSFCRVFLRKCQLMLLHLASWTRRFLRKKFLFQVYNWFLFNKADFLMLWSLKGRSSCVCMWPSTGSRILQPFLRHQNIPPPPHYFEGGGNWSSVVPSDAFDLCSHRLISEFQGFFLL